VGIESLRNYFKLATAKDELIRVLVKVDGGHHKYKYLDNIGQVLSCDGIFLFLNINVHKILEYRSL
jgi:hypothetical protein